MYVMKKMLQISTATILVIGVCVNECNAQVGVNVPAPAANAILDLTNVTNKALILPNSNGVDPIGLGTFSEQGMVFYHSNYVYLSTGAAIGDKKVISPWDFELSPTPAASLGPTIPLGIGIAPLTSAPFRVIVAAGGAVDLTGNAATIMVGTAVTNPHLSFGTDEILAKSSTAVGGTLKLQEEDGTVQVGNTASAPINDVRLTAHGSADVKGKVREKGMDLLPTNTIMLWNNATIPAGWAICNGTSGTPDLRDRFVVATGSTYALNNTGGANSVTLNTNQLPSHFHSANHGHTINDPGHQHGIVGWHGVGSLVGTSKEAMSSKNGVTDYGAPGKTGRMYNANTNVSVNGYTGNTGGVLTTGGGATATDAAHENRPPYYALYYIMKL